MVLSRDKINRCNYNLGKDMHELPPGIPNEGGRDASPTSILSELDNRWHCTSYEMLIRSSNTNQYLSSSWFRIDINYISWRINESINQSLGIEKSPIKAGWEGDVPGEHETCHEDVYSVIKQLIPFFFWWDIINLLFCTRSSQVITFTPHTQSS